MTENTTAARVDAAALLERIAGPAAGAAIVGASFDAAAGAIILQLEGPAIPEDLASCTLSLAHAGALVLSPRS